jgi:hypothetical protein
MRERIPVPELSAAKYVGSPLPDFARLNPGYSVVRASNRQLII